MSFKDILSGINENFIKEKSKNISKNDIEDAYKKADDIERKSKSGPLKKLLGDIKLLISLVKDYWTGEYKEIPWWAISAIVFTLLYVFNPLDLIPDIIPVIGLLDDAMVVSVCLYFVRQELFKYQDWKWNRKIETVMYCHIINCESKKAIDVTDWEKENGAMLQTWDVTKNDNQSWLFNNVNETETIISSKFNSKVLDVKDRDTSPNARVQLWDDFGSDNQRWIIEEIEDYRYRIKSVLSNKYLTSIISDEKTKIVLQDLNESDNQKWWLEWH